MKLTSYLKEITGRLKGDQDQVVAAKNERKANSAIKGQISSLEGKIVDLESEVEDAKEALETAKYPTFLIINNDGYCNAIKVAQDNLDDKQEVLKETTKWLEYFKALLVDYNKEVE